MDGKYRATNLGQAIQKTFRESGSTFEMIKKYWFNIVPEFMQNMEASKYVENTKTLFVTSPVPVIYIQQYSDNVKALCKSFFGDEIISSIKFTYKRHM